MSLKNIDNHTKLNQTNEANILKKLSSKYIQGYVLLRIRQSMLYNYMFYKLL